MTLAAASALAVITNAQTVIIKVGTALVVQKDGVGVNEAWLKALADDVAALRVQGKKVIIVSSGGIALGRPALGISADTKPQDIPLEHKQAASAVGQYHVFHGYSSAFGALNIQCAQVLLTMSETENRRMHLNARATLKALLDKNIIPIINENDSISTEEIRFGDNDRLAVRVGQMIGANLVVLLSTIDGLYTTNPQLDSDAEHIALIDGITDAHKEMAGDALPGLSTGGMKSKLQAARSAIRAGMSLIITDGQAEHALRDLAKNRSTLFTAQATDSTERKKWIGGSVAPKGRVTVDEGAIEALRKGKSLLPIGVKTVEGNFIRGDAVEVVSVDGNTLGIGLSAYDAGDAAKIIGKASAEIADILGYKGRSELIHRNDMALQD